MSSKVVIIVQDGTIQSIVADNSEVQVLVLDGDEKGENSQVFTDFDGTEFIATESTALWVKNTVVEHFFEQTEEQKRLKAEQACQDEKEFREWRRSFREKTQGLKHKEAT